MEITRQLRLDRPGSDGRVAIHLRICWEGKKVRLSSGEKVLPKDWDDDKVRTRVQFSSHINARLDRYETGIKEYIYKRQNDKQQVTPDMIRSEIERIRVEELGLGPKKEPAVEPVSLLPPIPSIQDFIYQRYIIELATDRSRSWKETVKTVARHLLAFRPKLDWHELTLSTLNMFKVYLQQEEELSDATLEAYIGTLRGMLKYAGRSSMPVPADYTYLEVRRAGDCVQPELLVPEINQLLQAHLDVDRLSEFTKNRSFSADDMELTRWYFVVACYTGLRHSDLWMVQNPSITHIENVPCLEVRQRKTTAPVVVPLTDNVYHLIKHPPYVRKPPIRFEYNTMLKLIGEQAGLDRVVRVGSYYRGELMTDILPLHQTVSSHMARRTFATLMTAGGMPTKILQELMGHSSISSTAKYSKVSNLMIVQQTLDAWQRYNLR